MNIKFNGDAVKRLTLVLEFGDGKSIHYELSGTTDDPMHTMATLSPGDLLGGTHRLHLAVIAPDGLLLRKDDRVIDNCPDCAVESGFEHIDGCDVARCMATGLQRLGCGRDHDCGRDMWSGRRAGQLECEEFGWWAVFTPTDTLPWRRCSADTPGAVHDLNRLMVEASWDAVRRRWVLPND